MRRGTKKKPRRDAGASLNREAIRLYDARIQGPSFRLAEPEIRASRRIATVHGKKMRRGRRHCHTKFRLPPLQNLHRCRRRAGNPADFCATDGCAYGIVRAVDGVKRSGGTIAMSRLSELTEA